MLNMNIIAFKKISDKLESAEFQNPALRIAKPLVAIKLKLWILQKRIKMIGSRLF